MYVQPLLLCTTIYVNEGIYQNVCMCVQKTEMKVLIEWLWNRVPKTNHVGNDILSFDVYDSISHFNDGAIASLEVLKNMNMEPGDHMMKGLQIQNESRKIHTAYRVSEPQHKRRKIIRHCRKKK